MRESGLLESALARAENKFAYNSPDLFDLAAAYAYGIASSHPFVDGNKRTALVTSFTFLYVNGQAVVAPQEENVRVFRSLAAGELAEADLATWFRKNCRAR